MRIFLNILILVAVLTSLNSCRKSQFALSPLNDSLSNALDTVYTSDHPYNLNVVLFVPSDMVPNADYERRISENLLYKQNFVKTWMQHWGYGAKTFGLLKNASNRVKIHVIQGKLPTSSYPYDGGEPAMWQEISDYFNTHQKSSDHYFILTTVNKYGKQMAPYYGIGTKCYGIDFPDMEIVNMGRTDTAGLASSWIGGNTHEMMHGLNLPHNGGLVSQNALYGTPIITGNGGTFVVAPTYLDAWDCAVLGNGQVFSSTARTDWYQDPGAKIKSLHAHYDDASQKVIVSGKFSSNKKVNFIGFTNDPKRSAGDGNYDSENWVVSPIGVDSFYTEIAITEFKDRGNYQNDFTISLIHENGYRHVNSYSYQMISGKPDIQFGDRPEYNKSNWSLLNFSSEESQAENGFAINLIDNDRSTQWVSRWTGTSSTHPHYFTIDMATIKPVNRFTFVQRAGGSKPKDIQIQVSSDNITWQNAGSYVLPNAAGPTDVKLTSTLNFRYFKVTITSATDGTQWAALSEIGTYKD
ncbi:discoidin domain-containing protein [Sphingobacterium detergens]|uniref:F5/8 type C domain-containing protein n=1 Tax=Sphingobacterium detergens TaxID=1145106 RepID=A0A420BKA4_SPHD1|nr:discoidin domain-containing protein [Sphingobacterium detergens]RKE57055.1 F5/8 type C domain-containing protein [Sphingobacterium detergens]